MEFIIDVFKKLLKITALYLVIGFIAVILISTVGGAGHSLLIGKSLGDMALPEYIMLMAYVEILWLPLLVGIIVSNLTYFTIPLHKVIFGVLVAVFFICMIAIASKE